MENSSFKTIPEDLQMEILSWLPLKSLGTCIFVSKTWAYIISGEDFRKIHLNRSMTRPQMMFMVERTKSESNSHDMEVLFHFVYQEEKPLLSSGEKPPLPISLEPLSSTISQPIRGFVCFQLGTKVAICNPVTKKFRTLPEIQVPKRSRSYTFFGYDEATNVFKVLSITKNLEDRDPITSTRYEVCTMGSGEESWRSITCEHDHLPTTKGLLKGKDLYYIGRSNSDNSLVLMSFDVSSEKLSVTDKLPKEVEFSFGQDLMNYNGQIALSNKVDKGVLHLWVRNESMVWLGKRIVIPRRKETVGAGEIDCTIGTGEIDCDRSFYFRGTIGTGELVFTQNGLYKTMCCITTKTRKISEDFRLES